MNNKRLLLTRAAIMLLLSCLTTTLIRAEDSKIIVWLNDGQTTEVLFNQMPEFVYQNGNVSITNGNTELSWPLAQLKKFTFEDIQPSTVTEIKDVKQSTRIDIVRGCAVYDINGRKIKSRINSLSELPKGTYIIKDGNVTTKVVRK